MGRKQKSVVKQITEAWNLSHIGWDTCEVETVGPWRDGESVSVFRKATLISNGKIISQENDHIKVGPRGGIRLS